jgi:NADPH:quinone reductase-like Zn-dependent oxidoreductase
MLHANALFPIIAALVGWSWFAWFGKASGRWSIPVPKGRVFAWAVAVVLVAFTVFRNLPGFGALAPPS